MEVTKVLIAISLAIMLMVSLFAFADYGTDEGSTAIENLTGRTDPDEDEDPEFAGEEKFGDKLTGFEPDKKFYHEFKRVNSV